MPQVEDYLIPDTPNAEHEIRLWKSGKVLVAGVDEAGRGALAGPVAAAAVILPDRSDLLSSLHGVRDSKQMTPKARERWAIQIKRLSLAHALGFATHHEIDCLGILPATILAIRRALQELQPAPEHILIDYIRLPDAPCAQTPLVKGDARSISIASASVLAKTGRDKIMCEFDREYPGYGFASHKGYGTSLHRAALEKFGPSPVHRLTFKFSASEKIA